MVEPLRSAIDKVLSEYPAARSEPLKGHSLASYIRKDLPALVESLLQPPLSDIEYIVCSSKFPGGWAYVPWVAVLDPRITRTTRKGLHVVLSFAENGRTAVLAVGQGAALSEVGLLAKNRQEMLEAVPPLAGFENGPIPQGMLGLSASATLYEIGAVCFKAYSRDSLPPDGVIFSDITRGLSHLDHLLKSPAFQAVKFARAKIRENR